MFIYSTLGNFEIPRKINGSDLADHFKISQSAIYEHIRKVERTLFNLIFL
jgi:predicted DNA binding protein